MGSYIGSQTVKKVIEINDRLLGTMARVHGNDYTMLEDESKSRRTLLEVHKAWCQPSFFDVLTESHWIGDRRKREVLNLKVEIIIVKTFFLEICISAPCET